MIKHKKVAEEIALMIEEQKPEWSFTERIMFGFTKTFDEICEDIIN